MVFERVAHVTSEMMSRLLGLLVLFPNSARQSQKNKFEDDVDAKYMFVFFSQFAHDFVDAFIKQSLLRLWEDGFM